MSKEKENPRALVARQEDETVADWRKRLTTAQKAELRAWRKAHRPGTEGVPRPDGRHPRQPCLPKPRRRQVRHTYGTRIRKEFGLEEAQIPLGHSKADVTQLYAERDMSKAADVAQRIGGLLRWA